MTLTLRRDTPTKATIIDEHGALVGTIEGDNAHKWRTFHIGDGPLLSSNFTDQQFDTLEAAFESFQQKH